MIAVLLIAMFTFGLNRGRSMDQINDTLVSSIKIIAMMLLIIGGGGAFKQVLVDSGVDKYIASMMHETNISPAADGTVDCPDAYRAGFRNRCINHCGWYRLESTADCNDGC